MLKLRHPVGKPWTFQLRKGLRTEILNEIIIYTHFINLLLSHLGKHYKFPCCFTFTGFQFQATVGEMLSRRSVLIYTAEKNACNKATRAWKSCINYI